MSAQHKTARQGGTTPVEATVTHTHNGSATEFIYLFPYYCTYWITFTYGLFDKLQLQLQRQIKNAYTET
jgi:hypothetical protein